MKLKSTRLSYVLASILSISSAVSATTFTPISDRELLDQSQVVAEVTVVARATAAGPKRPATDYTVQVEELYKGFVPGGAIVVRVPGSSSFGGTALKVWGAPSFRDGERALLFLAAQADGSYRIVHLGLGAFHEIVAGGRRLAVRDLAEMREIAPGLRMSEARDTPRDFDRFGAWLVNDTASLVSYQVRLSAAARAQVESEMRTRDPWPLPASQTLEPAQPEVAWQLAGSGQARPEGVQGIKGAFVVRRGDVDAARLLDAGKASALARRERLDCGSGGLVSISGSWLDGAKVIGGDVILQDGAGCLFADRAGAAEVRTFVADELAWAFLGDVAGQQPPPAGENPLPLAGAAAAARGATPVAPAAAADLPADGDIISVIDQTSPARGYRARACGFDMNDNGILGEPADCNVCDGVTQDPDGDGVKEDLIYVSCNAGTDNASCGGPGNPCRTIGFAWNNRADGPGDGAEDIVCFKGTCSETVTVGTSGIAASSSRATTRTVAAPFLLPKNPAMLVGWDADNDGSYPPFDPQDTAVLDGNLRGNLAMGIQNSKARSHVEYAHFTARDYGLGCPDESGFMKVAAGGGPVSHLYLHDLRLAEINTACASSSNRIVFNLFVGGTPVSHLALINIHVVGHGSFLVRGSGNGTGPYRFQNLSTRARGPAKNQAFGIKLWDELTGIEVLDSVFDLDPDRWGPCSDSVSTPGCQPSYAITASPCSQGWTIANNEMIDWKFGVALQPFAGTGFCTGRPIDNVVIDRNVIRNIYEPWRYGDMGIAVEGGTTTAATVGTVQITNNFLSSTPGWEACIWSNAGNAGGVNLGSVSIAGNTCVGAINRHAAITIGNVEGAENAFPQQRYVVKNNVVSGLAAGQRNVDVQYRPALWDADFNVFDPDAGFAWNGGSSASLSSWRTAYDRDVNSKTCNPAFVNGAAGDFHLAASDTCARNAGSPLSTLLLIDFDGDNRGQESAWDIGADEVRSPL